MADKRSIYQFASGLGQQNSLLLMDNPDASATSGYTTEKISIGELGAVLGAILYTQLLDTNVKNIFGGINELFARCMNIADDYDETLTYYTGDYVFYQNVLYKCNDDGVTGTWDATKWDITTVADEIILINTALSDLTITDITNSIGTVPTGITLVTSESAVYKQGKHVFGTLLFKATTALAENTDSKMITFASEHKPSRVQNFFGVTSNSQYNIANSVYAYISTSSGGSADLFVKANTGNQTIIKVQIDFMTF